MGQIGFAAVLVDLTRVGHHYFSTVLPRQIEYAALEASYNPLLMLTADGCSSTLGFVGALGREKHVSNYMMGTLFLQFVPPRTSPHATGMTSFLHQTYAGPRPATFPSRHTRRSGASSTGNNVILWVLTHIQKQAPSRSSQTGLAYPLAQP